MLQKLAIVVLLFACTTQAQQPSVSERGLSRFFSWFHHKDNGAKPGEPSPPPGNPQRWKFATAVRHIAEISNWNPVTVYCACNYKGKIVDVRGCGFISQHRTDRSTHIEWEHIAAAESFGQSFAMWRQGDPAKCVDPRKGAYKGRKCAEKDPEFLRMETDLYNLWPIIGELNVLRSNYSFAELTGSDYDFGACKVKIQSRKIEPMDEYKGVVARSYMYMDLVYPHHGIISEKNRPLYKTWDASFPVSDWECQRADLIKEVQGNANPILVERCSKQH